MCCPRALMTGSLHQHYLYLTDLHPMSNNQMAYSNNLKSYCQEHIVKIKKQRKDNRINSTEAV